MSKMLDDLSRRDALRVLSTSAAFLTPALAQHVHQEVAQVKSLSGGPNYAPKFFTKHQFDTMRALAELIIPADEHSPGATEAGAAEFIDFLCSRNADLATTFSGGLMWMDSHMLQMHKSTFLDAKPATQTMLLTTISNGTGAGHSFFVWARNLVCDAFYTSPAGVKDLGFMGNGAVATFSVPKEAVDYAMRRSPFAKDA